MVASFSRSVLRKLRIRCSARRPTEDFRDFLPFPTNRTVFFLSQPSLFKMTLILPFEAISYVEKTSLSEAKSKMNWRQYFPSVAHGEHRRQSLSYTCVYGE